MYVFFYLVWDALSKTSANAELPLTIIKGKEPSTTLLAAAIQDILEQNTLLYGNRTLVLFSDDKDLYYVIDIAIMLGYHVEVFGFFWNVNEPILQRARDHYSQLTIRYMDHFFEQVTFHTYEWSDTNFPLDVSIVAT